MAYFVMAEGSRLERLCHEKLYINSRTPEVCVGWVDGDCCVQASSRSGVWCQIGWRKGRLQSRKNGPDRKGLQWAILHPSPSLPPSPTDYLKAPLHPLWQGVQELRPAGGHHPGGGGGGVSDPGQGPHDRCRHRPREGGARRQLLQGAQALSQCRLLLR